MCARTPRILGREEERSLGMSKMADEADDREIEERAKEVESLRQLLEEKVEV